MTNNFGLLESLFQRADKLNQNLRLLSIGNLSSEWKLKEVVLCSTTDHEEYSLCYLIPKEELVNMSRIIHPDLSVRIIYR